MGADTHGLSSFDLAGLVSTADSPRLGTPATVNLRARGNAPKPDPFVQPIERHGGPRARQRPLPANGPRGHRHARGPG